jgi:hypothetical protein
MYKVYLVFYNADQIEGRGHMVFDKAFSNWDAADKYAQSKYNAYGHGYHGWADVREVTVYNKVPDATEEARQKALAKLTVEERKILGI